MDGSELGSVETSVALSRRLPERFAPALVRAITPVDDNWREMGVELIQPSGEIVSCRLDVQQARGLFESLGQALGAHEARTDHKKPAVNADYATDDYPRDGCTIVIDLSMDKYCWRVYRPDIRLVASGTAMESYFPRKLGSLGAAIDAFARGRAVRSAFTEMARAEGAYESECGSSVTS